MIKKNYLKTSPLCKVTFTLPKAAIEGANEVRVLGDFNNWEWEKGVPMTETAEAYTAELGLEAGQSYEFRYRGDNFVWENDWAADKYVSSPFAGITNSVVELPAEFKIAETPVKKTRKKATTTKKTVAKKTTAKAKAPVKKATTTKAKTTRAKKDDLKKIEGIGPKIAGLLAEEGINTFADLSTAKITVLKNVLKNAGPRFKMHTPDTWAEQAKLAAKGDWDTLAKLQVELKGGKRK